MCSAIFLWSIIYHCETRPSHDVLSIHIEIMSKRRRTSAGFAAKRPIDKALININLNDVSATQQTTVLLAPAAACTVLGIRWSMFIEGDAGSVGSPHEFRWAIIQLPDGRTAEELDSTNAGSLYEPEQQVLAFGIGVSRVSSTSSVSQFVPTIVGKTKSMRKLRVGDRVVFIVKGIATETIRVRGIVQLFCKS